MPAVPSHEQRLREIIREEIRKAQRSPLSNSGLSVPGPSVVQVDGEFRGAGFDGDLATDDVGTTGFALGATKAAMPELLLRPGSVGNDSLTSPVSFGSDVTGAGGGSVSTSSVVKATATVPVPAGFTIAQVKATAIGMAVNSTAAVDYLYCDANINGVSGGETYVAVDPGTGSSATGFASRTLTGLSGGTITATVMSRTSFAGWAANAANQFNIHVEVAFLR